MRGENYDSFGTTATPKVGLIYSPGADFSLKASWGKSFKAPTLFQRYYSVSAYLYSPQILGGSSYPADASTLLLYRSEEHTSELQSLMRISYAVFCLKKKKQNT